MIKKTVTFSDKFVYAEDYLNSKISRFWDVMSITPWGSCTLKEYFELIQMNFNGEAVEYRNGNIDKRDIECVTPSGTFSQRNSKSIETKTNIIVLDLDRKDNMHMSDYELANASDKIYINISCIAKHKSVSGKGYAIYIAVTNDFDFSDYGVVREYFEKKYNVVFDDLVVFPHARDAD